ncbi:hypothetical protein N0V83_009326 [Neocucurbitaria cava]|uniref:Uncharacterized protein n=1 Tax=Neocucurbitaria cava TaxID=798079 RepID=A0A9W8Y1N6_9PLEO|nr:hypothetical protein N0V83_009326 [Neocucurbitaria cava]
MLPVAPLVLGCVGVVVGLALITIVITRDRNFSLRSIHSALSRPPDDIESQPDEEFEKYGELVIPPDRQPTHAGLDIITRVLLGIGLPGGATHSSSRTSGTNAPSTMDVPPRLSLHLSRPTSMTPSEEHKPVMTEAEASAAALGAGRSFIQNIKDAARLLKAEQHSLNSSHHEHAAQRIKAGHWVVVAREDAAKSKFVEEFEMQEIFVVGDDDEETAQQEIVVDPMSSAYGTGKAMAGLYR